MISNPIIIIIYRILQNGKWLMHLRLPLLQLSPLQINSKLLRINKLRCLINLRVFLTGHHRHTLYFPLFRQLELRLNIHQDVPLSLLHGHQSLHILLILVVFRLVVLVRIERLFRLLNWLLLVDILILTRAAFLDCLNWRVEHSIVVICSHF
jgi:hypothetical protein